MKLGVQSKAPVLGLRVAPPGSAVLEKVSGRPCGSLAVSWM